MAAFLQRPDHRIFGRDNGGRSGNRIPDQSVLRRIEIRRITGQRDLSEPVDLSGFDPDDHGHRRAARELRIGPDNVERDAGDPDVNGGPIAGRFIENGDQTFAVVPGLDQEAERTGDRFFPVLDQA